MSGEEEEEVYDIGAIDACFDCGDTSVVEDPWLSVNNGVIICIKCAGEHRGLGVAVSRVRSLVLDEYDDIALRSIKYGGNEALPAFLEEKGVARDKWLSLTIEERYLLPEAELYRRRLAFLSEGGAQEEAPDDLREPEKRVVTDSMRQNTVHWTPDADTRSCELCKSKFTLFKRRHHCRDCGRCACGECAPKRSLAKHGSTPVRLCKLCFLPPARTIDELEKSISNTALSRTNSLKKLKNTG